MVTLVKDTIDAWLATVLEGFRDNLRKNTVIGLSGSDRASTIEIGDVSLGELIKNPDDAITIWIVPKRDDPRRTGNVIEHTIHLELHAYALAQLQPQSAFADAQARLRQFTGRVWNEALHLKEVGRSAGWWDDWYPDGSIEWNAIGLDDRSLLSGVVKFAFMRDVIWITEGA